MTIQLQPAVHGWDEKFLAVVEAKETIGDGGRTWDIDVPNGIKDTHGEALAAATAYADALWNMGEDRIPRPF